MGNPQFDAAPRRASAEVKSFYSERSWIEGNALDQVRSIREIEGVKEIAAFPDLHVGKFGPVGVAVRSSRLHPAMIGNDIGCGMAVFRLDLPLRKLKLEKAFDRWRQLSDEAEGDWTSDLESIGLSGLTFASGLATVGGGNHFCELQAVDAVYLEGKGIQRDELYLLVHSGSRSHGERVFSEIPDADRYVMGDSLVEQYLVDHDRCVRWASLNRSLIAARAARLIGADVEPVCDVPHNMVDRVSDGYLHRKGAAVAHEGRLVPIAGSRASLSFMVQPTASITSSMNSMSHGAGRKYDRQSMHHRVGGTRSERDALARNEWGGLAICEDKALLLEEAGSAYKSAKQVVADLQDFGLVQPVASMKPLLTFKKANLFTEENRDKRNAHEARRQDRRNKRG